MSSEGLPTCSVFLHVRADTCIRDYSRILVIALRLIRSPVLRLVDVVVWHMHVATKMASTCWTAGKEYSSQGNWQAQRQTQKQFFQEEQYFQQENRRFCNSEKFDNGTVDKDNCCCRDMFPPLSEPHPAHCRNTFSDDVTTTMIMTITMSKRHPSAQHLVGNCAFHVENCAFSVEKFALRMERCALLATALVGSFLPWRFFGVR